MTDDHARLALTDAMQLGELLTFLHDWLNGPDSSTLATSMRRFVGTDGYDLDELRRDLARFAFLLGTDDGTRAFDPSHDDPPRPG